MLTCVMSLLLLIDGYNVIAPVAAPVRMPSRDWLERERRLLLTRLSQHLPDPVRRRCCVVFDAAHPPPGATDQYEVAAISVRFAVGYEEADDLLEELIAAHSAPKQLTVVSSDHRIQAAARHRNATAFESQAWFDELLDDRVQLVPGRLGRVGQGDADDPPEKPVDVVDQDQLRDWMQEFGFDQP